MIRACATAYPHGFLLRKAHFFGALSENWIPHEHPIPQIHHLFSKLCEVNFFFGDRKLGEPRVYGTYSHS